jgi:hypothetical protein
MTGESRPSSSHDSPDLRPRHVHASQGAALTVKGYMFDFSGTLMRVEPTEDWLRAVLDDLGIDAAARERAECAERLERLGALPGGVSPSVLPDRLRVAWDRRDLDPESHRAAYVGLMREADLPWGRRSSTPCTPAT